MYGFGADSVYDLVTGQPRQDMSWTGYRVGSLNGLFSGTRDPGQGEPRGHVLIVGVADFFQMSQGSVPVN